MSYFNLLLGFYPSPTIRLSGLSFFLNNFFRNPLLSRSGRVYSCFAKVDDFYEIHHLLVSISSHEESHLKHFPGLFFFQAWSLPILFIAEEAVKGRSTYGYCHLSRTKKRPRVGSIQHPGLRGPGAQMEPSSRCGTSRGERPQDCAQLCRHSG